MWIHTIKTEVEYETALQMIDTLLEAEENSEQTERFLGVCVPLLAKDWECAMTGTGRELRDINLEVVFTR